MSTCSSIVSSGYSSATSSVTSSTVTNESYEAALKLINNQEKEIKGLKERIKVLTDMDANSQASIKALLEKDTITSAYIKKLEELAYKQVEETAQVAINAISRSQGSK